MEWKNIGYEVYKEIMGEDEFNKKMEEANKIRPTGIFDGVQLAYHTKKIMFLFGAAALNSRKRPTHSIGVGALGMATIVNDAQFPSCDFFTPGTSFPVCLRHSTLKSAEDAGLMFVGAAIRFASSDRDSPFDLLMSTGRGAALWNVETIYQAMEANSTGNTRKYYLQSPDNLACNIEGLRHCPDSFYDQRYYSEVIYDFIAFDGVRRYVRFRMIPADGSPETGLLTEEQQRKAWDKARLPSETRDKNCLKILFKDQLSKGTIRYKLQLTLHIPQREDPADILHIGRYWDESTHPWLDLADLTITTLLTPDITEHLQFNICHVPPSLKFLPARSIHDYNCINHIRKDVYAWTQKIRLMRPQKQQPENMATYIINVKTGSQSGAGTKANIYISLTGTAGQTELIPLNSWREDFKEGKTNDYKVEAMDVGDVLMVQLHNDGDGRWYKNSDWFVNKISVLSSKSTDVFHFPCYRWVQSDMVVFRGKGGLPFQDQPEIVRQQRCLELKKRKEEYKWGKQSGLEDLPGFISAAKHGDLPRDSQFSNAASRSFYLGALRGATNLGLSHLFTLFGSWDDFSDFKKLFTRCICDAPKIAEGNRWMNDAVFGYQYLNGCNPVVIQRCDEVPNNFPVTNDLVELFLDRGMTLEDEIKAGHVYIADYKELEGISRSKLGYAAEPIGLFYVKSSGDLVPIAIQLRQEPFDANPIWTPRDSHYDWLLAKMWLRNADHQIHQMGTHLLKTHLLIETFAVAAWRQLASSHPVFQLLFPHLRSVMAINTIGRSELINEGGITDKTLSMGGGGHIQLIKKLYKKFTFDMLSLPDQLLKRGVNDPEKLPNFHYRDDGLRLWNAIRDFIHEVVFTFYQSETDITKDHELQSWVLDLHENGFPVKNGDVDHGIPKNLATRDQLVHFLTCMVFTCSCQHAAVNFSQMEITGFVPNTPPIMRRPPPTKKNQTTMNSVMDTLPNKSQAGWHIATMYSLTRYAEDEALECFHQRNETSVASFLRTDNKYSRSYRLTRYINRGTIEKSCSSVRYLGDYSHSPLTDEAVESAISRFQETLQNISQVIHKRNASLEFPYIYLLPERIPNSIAI